MSRKIEVHHPNGYYGVLYGECSMIIYSKTQEVLHTGFRNVNTADELYNILETMPEFVGLLVNEEKNDPQYEERETRDFYRSWD